MHERFQLEKLVPVLRHLAEANDTLTSTPTRIKQLINDWRSVLEPARLLFVEVAGTISFIYLVVRAMLR
jgi:hypothetical protein